MSNQETTHTNGTHHKQAFHRTKALPPIDVYENGDEILAVADIPGVRSDALSVHVEGGALRFEGNTDGSLVFVRSLALPEGVDEERITAEVKNGVLVIHMPKLARAKTRQIPVKLG